MKKIIGRIFLLIGTLLILASAALVAYNLYDSKRAEKASLEIVDALEDLMEEEDLDDDGLDNDSPRPLYQQYPSMPMPTKVIDGYRYIGILEIPSKDLKLPVMEEWDYSRLKISPCRYSGSVYLHNIVIAGHNYLRHFTPIKSIKNGAKVRFKDMNGNVFKYEVGWTEVIAPKDTEAMMTETEENPWDLTLFTCTTGGESRFTVRCILVDEKPAKEK